MRTPTRNSRFVAAILGAALALIAVAGPVAAGSTQQVTIVSHVTFNPDGTNGVYGGYQDWIDRAGRFRSPGDGEIDFGAIFSKLAQYEYEGWAVLEWECCIKDSEQGAAEGSVFIKNHMISVTHRAFDDFAGGVSDKKTNRKILGLE